MENLLAQAGQVGQAVGQGGGAQVNFQTPKAFQSANFLTADVGQWISWGITIVLIVAAVIFFFMLVIGGIKWILSGGDKAQTESARNQITAALVGLIIVFAAWAIGTLLQSVFGINIFNFTIPAL